jgi:hypothetical protein
MNETLHLAPEPSEAAAKKRFAIPKALRLPALLCAVAVVAAVGVCVGIKLAPAPVESTAGSGVGLTIDKNAGQFVAKETEQTASKGVAIPGWGSIALNANDVEADVDFYNPEANADLYYLTFELRLPDDSDQGYETLYTSGLVEPGLHIQHITLSRGLSAGEYEAVVHVQPYKMDDEQTPTNNADMKTTLKVS